MFVVVPLANVPSPEKTERFLGLISKIGPFTHQNEPKCHAYAWFRNAGDNDGVPNHWVRGIEAYESPEDNRETHRAGQAYRDFRAAVAAENLLDGYPDMRFWRPTGIGFLTRSTMNLIENRDDARDYIMVQDMTPRKGAKANVLEAFAAVVKRAKHRPEVGSFWILGREKEVEDCDDVVAFTRFDSKADYEAFVTGEGEIWKRVDDLCEQVQTTTWTESGIGYLGR